MDQTALVVGFGAAALNAVAAMRNSGFEGTIRVLAKEERLPYAPVLTSYVAGGAKDPGNCTLATQEQLERLGVDIVYGACATSIDTAAKTVTASGTVYPYDVCLIATGATPSLCGFEAWPAPCKTLRTMQDALDLAQTLSANSNARILISGTSMVALKALEACLEHGVDVTLLGRSSHILKRSALPQTASAFEDELARRGVTLRLGQQIADAVALADGSVQVTFSDGQTSRFDDVVVAHGMTPNIGFASSALASERGLVVDEFMRTSDECVFAAGDVAQVANLSAPAGADGKPATSIAGLWKEACLQGMVAGRAMAAALAGTTPTLSYPGFIPNNTVFVGSATAICAGSISLECDRYVATTQTQDGFICAVMEPQEGRCDKLVGFNVFNAQGKPGSHAFDEASAYLKRLKEELGAPARAALDAAAAPSQHTYTPRQGDLLANAGLIREFTGQCAECGRCTKSCASLSAAGLTLGGIAKGLLDCQAASQDQSDLMMELMGNYELTQAVRGCFLCTGCQQTCFAHNNILDLIHAARVEFQTLELIPQYAWSSVLVDQEWHIFNAYRAIWGIGYPDLVRHLDDQGNPAGGSFDIAFFPGCSLAAYGPSLTREVFAQIEQSGKSVTMIDKCCGSSLKSAGFYSRATALLNRIAQEIAASGAKQVVCVCPGCRNNLQEAFERGGCKIEAVNLVTYLIEQGFAPKQDLSSMKIRLSKSCQDRDGSYLQQTRELMGLPQGTPIAYGGCCGAGGAVGPYNDDQKNAQVARKLACAQEGETLVTMCPTCTYTYAFDLSANPRPINNKNYLELLFDAQFDWDTVFAQLNGMWTGEYGPWLQNIFG